MIEAFKEALFEVNKLDDDIMCVGCYNHKRDYIVVSQSGNNYIFMNKLKNITVTKYHGKIEFLLYPEDIKKLKSILLYIVNNYGTVTVGLGDHLKVFSSNKVLDNKAYRTIVSRKYSIKLFKNRMLCKFLKLVPKYNSTFKSLSNM